MRKFDKFDMKVLASSNPIDLGVLDQALAFAAFAAAPSPCAPMVTEYALQGPFEERATLSARSKK